MSVTLVIHVQGSEWRPGQVVRGSVEVARGGHSRRLTVSLRQADRTPDYTGTMWRTEAATLHEGDLTSGASFAFALELPGDAIPSFRGRHGEAFWDVHVHSDQHGLDRHVHQEITVMARERPMSTA